MRIRVLTGAACAAALLATACGGDTDAGEPTPGSSESDSEEASSTAKYGAPSVPEPLDATGIVDDPCGALTDRQLDEFHGTVDDSTHTTEATPLSDKKTACNWSFEGDRYSLGGFVAGVALPRDTFDGLSSSYRANQAGKYDTFDPFEAADYPAVINNQTGSPGEGECTLSVGLRDDTVYQISTLLDTDHPNYDEPCKTGKKLASFVVQNLKEGK